MAINKMLLSIDFPIIQDESNNIFFNQFESNEGEKDILFNSANNKESSTKDQLEGSQNNFYLFITKEDIDNIKNNSKNNSLENFNSSNRNSIKQKKQNVSVLKIISFFLLFFREKYKDNKKSLQIYFFIILLIIIFILGLSLLYFYKINKLKKNFPIIILKSF
jgi:hypothetical protein